LKSNNVDVKIFNNNYFSRTGLNITHRKIIVSDSDSCIIGGMNFGEKYEHEWHDAVFLLKGHISNELQKHFLYDWEKAGGKYPKKLVKIRKRTKYGNKLMKVIRTNVIPDNVEHEFYKEMQKAIRNTKKEIYMTSPYFSDDQIIKDLICAKKRGVKITIVLPENNNHLIFKNLNLYTAKVFFDSGIDVYFYKPNFSHLKVYVFDDKTIIGSANIDQRSFTGNQEIGVLVDDNEFSKKIKNDIFIKDINFPKKLQNKC
jgi:cardiolipin synthase